MKKRIIEISREILVILMNHWVFALAALTLMGIFPVEKPYVALWPFLSVIPVAFYAIREKVQKFYLFFLLHFAFLALAVLVPLELFPKICIILITAVYIILSVRIRILEGVTRVEQFHPIFMVVAMAVLSMALQRFSEKNWQWIYVAAVLLYFVCYFLRSFLLDYEQFLVFNASSASNLPEKAVFRSGMKQTLLFISVSVGVMLLAAGVKGLAALGNMLKNGLLGILRFLFSLLPEEAEVKEEIVEEVIVPSAQSGMQELMPAGEAGKFWVILQEILLVLVTVGTIVAAVWALVKFCKYLWDRFHRSSEQVWMDSDSVRDIRENCQIERGSVRKSRIPLFRDNREKVRRIYRSRILKRKAEIIGAQPSEILAYFTAGECCQAISERELERVYEKARYTEEDISVEEVKRARGGRRR